MPSAPLYPQRGRFSITPQGAEDLRSAETCQCVQVIDAGMVVCHECGTVYGLLRQSAAAGSTWSPRKAVGS